MNMKTDWHASIQSYLAGQSSAEEAAELQNALKADAELRALFLDYANLDAALGTLAEAARPPAAVLAASPQRTARWFTWRTLSAAAACAALLAGALFFSRPASRSQPDFTAAFASTEDAIARLPAPQTAPLPEWISPTAGILAPQGLPLLRF